MRKILLSLFVHLLAFDYPMQTKPPKASELLRWNKMVGPAGGKIGESLHFMQMSSFRMENLGVSLLCWGVT